jgi:class 3 adenylate cyclase
MVLEPALRNDLIELLAANFKTEEINELGCLVLGRFDSNEASGVSASFSLSSRKSARLLVDSCDHVSQVPELLKLVVEVDDGVVHGRSVKVGGLEVFLGKLLRAGMHYDFKTHRIVSARKDSMELANWGCLREGHAYETTLISLDIAGNSMLVRAHGLRKMERLYYDLSCFLREKLAAVDGRIWSWAGDGGIVAFAFKDHVQRAVRYAVEVQNAIPIFNLMSESSEGSVDISLRIGIDSGPVRFRNDTGRIVSDVINYAAHLEKKCTRPGCISCSRPVYDALSVRLGSLFRYGGIFEGKDCFTTVRRLDGLLLERRDDDQDLIPAEEELVEMAQ